jgi:hypothetical protein
MITFFSNIKGVEPTTITPSSGISTIDLRDNNNFKVNLNNEASTIRLNNPGEVIGQGGNIVITNPSSVGSLSIAVNIAGTESYVKIPGGSSISYNTLANNVHLLSYYVNASDQVLVNYIGLFA